MSENKNNLVCISGVRGYEEDGVAYLHIEDVARGLGFTEQKDGVEYVRWRTVDSHLSSLAFATSCENGRTFEIKSFVYTRKSVRAFFEFVENNPMGWQARNRKSILYEWLNHHMTIPA